MKIRQLISELTEKHFKLYQTIAYVEFEDTTNITNIAQLVRSVKYVTVVNNKSDKEDLRPRGLLLIKALTPLTEEQTFDQIKKDSLATIPELKKFLYSKKHLEKVKDI